MTNLQKLLKVKGINDQTVCNVIRAKSNKTAWNKVTGVTALTLRDAMAIQSQLFPEYRMEFLFDGYYGFNDTDNGTEDDALEKNEAGAVPA